MRRFLTLLFLIFISFSYLHSAHIIGGMMSYEYMSTNNNINRYKITLRVFRDCSSNQNGQFDFGADISIGTSDGGYFDENVDFGNPVISNLNNLFSNPCLVLPPGVCVQEGVYTKIVDLPIDNVNSYYIIYQRCCRNSTIFNILNPSLVGATYYTEITPLAQQLHNSSPTFKTIPPIAICGNFSLEFDHAGTDIDGDSLVYYFVAPIVGGGQDNGSGCTSVIPNPDCLPPYDSVTYRPPFTSRSPMGGSPAIAIDSKTGLLTGLPNSTGQFVVGVRIDEYRNGVLLSSTLRDFQFNVTDCEKVIKASIKADKTIGRDIEFKFCGTEYTEIDNRSTQASSIFNYTWLVSRNGVDSVYTTADLDLTKFGFGDYTGTMILNQGLQCTDTAFFKFTKFPGINADFTYDYDTCKHEGVALENLSTSEVNLNLNNKWFNGAIFSSSKDPVIKFDADGNYSVTLRVDDINQCADSITKIIPYHPIPEKILELDNINGCVPALIEFPNLHAGITDDYTVTWDFGDGETGTGVNPEHEYKVIADYDIKVKVVDPVGCEYFGDFPKAIRIHDVPVAGFDYSPREVSNLKPNIQIMDLSNKAIEWEYDFGTGDKSELQNPSYVFRDTGFFEIKQLVKTKDGCVDSAFLMVDITPINTVFLPNAFLPSTEGDNGTFRPAGNGFGIKGYQLSIYDRYGEELYRTDNWDKGWTGLDKNGRTAPNGTYIVKVRLTGPRGEQKELQGSAVLIR